MTASCARAVAVTQKHDQHSRTRTRDKQTRDARSKGNGVDKRLFIDFCGSSQEPRALNTHSLVELVDHTGVHAVHNFPLELALEIHQT